MAEKIEANLAMVEKAFIDVFSSNAEAALQKTDNNQDLKRKLESVKKKLVIRPTSISTVPEDVCEAFALSVLSGFYSSGSKSEKYNSDNSTLFNQLIEEIGNTVQNGEFKVVVKEQLYRVKYTSLNALGTGIGVEFAWVYFGDSNASVAIISWGSSFEEMKSALAGYCAKLAELNKDILNDLVVSYVHGALKDLGIGLNKKTVKNFFKLAEQTIKAINGDKGAIKEIVKTLWSIAGDKISGRDKIPDLISTEFKEGPKIVKSAELLLKMRRSVDDFKNSRGFLGIIGNFFNGNNDATAQHAFEKVKTLYQQLNTDKLFEKYFKVDRPLTEWPEGW